MLLITLLFILAFAAAFHFYWGFGGKLGVSVSLPQLENGQPAFQQTAVGAHLVGLVLIGIMVLLLALYNYISLPINHKYITTCIGFFSIAFLARALSWYKYAGLFKTLRHTEFAKYDTWLYSPLCLYLGLGWVCFISPSVLKQSHYEQ